MRRKYDNGFWSRQPVSKLVQKLSVVIALYRHSGRTMRNENAGNVIAANLQTRIEWLRFYTTPLFYRVEGAFPS